MTDHDLLIKVEQKVTTLCSSMKNLEKDNKEEHKKIIDLIDRNLDKVEERFMKTDTDCNVCKVEIRKDIKSKTDLGIFKFIISGLAGLILIAITTVGSLTIKNKMAIFEIKKLITNHVVFSHMNKNKYEESSISMPDNIKDALEQYRKIENDILEMESQVVK